MRRIVYFAIAASFPLLCVGAIVRIKKIGEMQNALGSVTPSTVVQWILDSYYFMLFSILLHSIAFCVIALELWRQYQMNGSRK